MGLVRSLARRYRDMGLPVEDLLQEGAIGVLEAIENFDVSNGASFSTYAVLAGPAHDDPRPHGSRTTAPAAEERPRARRAIADARAQLVNAGHRPTAGALAEATQLTVDDVVAAMDAPTTIASLDAPLTDGSTLEGTVADPAATEPPAAVLARADRAALADAVDHLGPAASGHRRPLRPQRRTEDAHRDRGRAARLGRTRAGDRKRRPEQPRPGARLSARGPVGACLAAAVQPSRRA